VLEAALGELPRDLDVGVGARLHLAEHLEDRALVEHHRGVGVLEHDRATHLHLAVGRHEVQHRDGEVGVDEGVVEDDVVALGIGDHGEQLALLALEELGPRMSRPPPDEELVPLLAPAGQVGVDHHPGEQGLLAHHLDPGGRRLGEPALGHARPALALDVRGQVGVEHLVEQGGIAHGGSSCPPSCRLNQ
jgi:hypothetical protein